MTLGHLANAVLDHFDLLDRVFIMLGFFIAYGQGLWL